MNTVVLGALRLLGLLCVAACGGANERCTDCERDGASAMPTHDGGTDAGPAPDAGAADAGHAEAGVSVDGSSSADGALADGGAAPMDGSEQDAALIECRVEADCVLPPALIACERCQDGSSACPEVHCVEGYCATLIAAPCAEHSPSETCTRDEDCARPACKLLCQGDGRSACLPSRCRGNLCVPSYGTCGLSLEPCTEGNRAGSECGACEDDGGCSFRVIGCFETCDAGAACPGGEACVEGLCQLTTCPPPA